MAVGIASIVARTAAATNRSISAGSGVGATRRHPAAVAANTMHMNTNKVTLFIVAPLWFVIVFDVDCCFNVERPNYRRSTISRLYSGK